MSTINTDEFFLDAARILTRLQGAFPQPFILQVDDICGAEETDEYGMHSARYLSCFSAMLWLGEEGYLRYTDTIRSEAIDQAVLSARCFVLLTKPNPGLPAEPTTEPTDELPQSVAAARTSLGYQLRTALHPRDSIYVNDLMLQLMQQMLSR